MGKRRNTYLPALAVGLLLLGSVAGCAGAPGPNNVAEVATGHLSNFWAGLWHGIILPITFVVSLFTDEISIYDVHNNGNWYDFGYVLGLSFHGGVFGQGSRAASSRRSRGSG
ncbi:hypothetical protein [Pilimelia columellifera]|uniref:Uncharacterized protein n=1 Tax=Pilimelia columellifera subsp. columellifera TaxID=706583 RepID=A0ABP6AGN1_9ACTN